MLLKVRQGVSGGESKMSLTLCRWEQKNFTMKLVGGTLPGHCRKSNATGAREGFVKLHLFLSACEQPVTLFSLQAAFFLGLYTSFSAFSLLTLQFQEASRFERMHLCVKNACLICSSPSVGLQARSRLAAVAFFWRGKKAEGVDGSLTPYLIML